MNSITTSHPVLYRNSWMFGRDFDLFFFFASYFIGLLFLLVANQTMSPKDALLLALMLTAFGLGPFHQGPTWFAYLDAKNQAHWKKDPIRKAIFYAGPPIILLISIIGVFKFPGFIGITWILWSIQHLVQQNVGILLLYHNHKANEIIIPRPIEDKSQQIAAGFFTLVFWRRCILGPGNHPLMDSIIVISAVVSSILIFAYLWQTWQQGKKGKVLNVPAFVFWLLSVISLWPMAFIGKNFAVGFLAPLVWHWWQYIGLNFKLVKNKYTGERLNNLPRSNPILLFMIICFVFVAINVVLIVFTSGPTVISDFVKNILIAGLFALGFSHYFLDAFLWRFRESYQRETILPYLKMGSAN